MFQPEFKCRAFNLKLYYFHLLKPVHPRAIRNVFYFYSFNLRFFSEATLLLAEVTAEWHVETCSQSQRLKTFPPHLNCFARPKLSDYTDVENYWLSVQQKIKIERTNSSKRTHCWENCLCLMWESCSASFKPALSFRGRDQKWWLGLIWKWWI